ncbi:hypothetical protein RUM43_002892 [Polyplax serrata]|uniref:Uncharacterized protein n=1 Tax=Polyplax serrata TaxID=468196 RepID=A0AAN8S2V6_POLSC
MPRCLMAKKWKSYPWTDREGGLQILDQNEPTARQEEDDEEIDVVGDANDCSQVSSCWVPIPAPNGWSPSSPTAGATAPSPPPAQSGLDMASRIAVLYNVLATSYKIISLRVNNISLLLNRYSARFPGTLTGRPGIRERGRGGLGVEGVKIPPEKRRKTEAIKQEIPLESSLSSGKSENLRKHLEIRSKY